ncbi:MAG: hypothetical protein PHT34_01675 [Oscillospiraceae bacterium]|nr:hypothetical protein [Oscillospiraceae bacterium]
MKAIKLLLSLAAMMLALGAIVCALVAYWDNLLDLCDGALKRLSHGKGSCRFAGGEEDFGDFADVK